MRILASSSFVTLLAILAAVACNKPNSTPPPATGPGAAPSGYPTGQYPPPGYQQAPPPGYQQPAPTGGYAPAPQGYPPAGPAGAPPQGPAPTGAPPAGGGAPMATPGPLALPCQNDQACGLAHCNTQYGKCAFPCQSAADCIQGASCNSMTGFCLPGGG